MLIYVVWFPRDGRAAGSLHGAFCGAPGVVGADVQTLCGSDRDISRLVHPIGTGRSLPELHPTYLPNLRYLYIRYPDLGFNQPLPPPCLLHLPPIPIAPALSGSAFTCLPRSLVALRQRPLPSNTGEPNIPHQSSASHILAEYLTTSPLICESVDGRSKPPTRILSPRLSIAVATLPCLPIVTRQPGISRIISITSIDPACIP